MAKVPAHLQKYCVSQNQARYTNIDHAVWRFIMRQLTSYLSKNAHPCYLDGMAKTGISIETIPSIETIDKHLQQFGWSAVPVSGFIPPAAFMELQSLGILPIASDMRTVDHLDYTPAPDIVHEAAGHAPILIHPEFSAYLHRYAEVASKAILDKEDLDLYEAIRDLSDLKESPDSTSEDVKRAEQHLEDVSKSITHLSEGALLARMNWWTAEYGLIGELNNPKIYGAGLLSSVGESRWALTDKVKKIPFSLDCINYAYDITEPQPQLFVTPDFDTLTAVLEEFADTMAFRRGGADGLKKLKIARTVNTVELNSGLQISGVLDNCLEMPSGLYLQFKGPSQLCYKNQELAGHGRNYHKEGFGSPVGFLKGGNRCLSTYTENELKLLGLVSGAQAKLEFQSGVTVSGTYRGAMIKDGKLLLLKFKNCTVKAGDRVLFQPEWGDFDMAVGSSIPSVFGGPADRVAYGETIDFAAKRVPEHKLTDEERQIDGLFKRLREIRQSFTGSPAQMTDLSLLLETVRAKFPRQWLLKMEILELALKAPQAPEWSSSVTADLKSAITERPQLKESIETGLALAQQKY
ncbi:MAG TPA: aromatic amino acid hydroxylase [Bdellovibrionales bacterium]|nr:aromatic amino acid hydroxylase [Bdellovibrionales bacterium]